MQQFSAPGSGGGPFVHDRLDGRGAVDSHSTVDAWAVDRCHDVIHELFNDLPGPVGAGNVRHRPTHHYEHGD
ncbi:MAG: hypothetical protein M3083_04140 [Actinomycetota bacterium]|nr:hypothetical protein [Actinomycetota bacterium]MDQ6947444.1 hypothetical protein [Actinomycetota bacterium]